MFEMFTDAGNAAVGEIVRKVLTFAKDLDLDRDTTYDRIWAELMLLQRVEVFAEAGDTAVREAVWSAVCAALPEAVFN